MRRVRREWTEEEVDYLYDHVGAMSYRRIGYNLGRTEKSVISKVTRLKISLKENQDWVNVQDFCDAINVSRSSFNYWISQHNFPTSKPSYMKYRKIYLHKFWKWAKEHKKIVDWVAFEPLALGEEPKWVDEIRKNTRLSRQKKPWTSREIQTLKSLLDKGATYLDLSMALNRSQPAIKRKIYDLYFPQPKQLKKQEWTDEEIKKAVKQLESGRSATEVAIALNRSEAGLYQILERNGYRFEKRMLVPLSAEAAEVANTVRRLESDN